MFIWENLKILQETPQLRQIYSSFEGVSKVIKRFLNSQELQQEKFSEPSMITITKGEIQGVFLLFIFNFTFRELQVRKEVLAH